MSRLTTKQRRSRRRNKRGVWFSKGADFFWPPAVAAQLNALWERLTRETDPA